MSLYLDASVLVALLRNETGTEQAYALVTSATEPLVVSDYAVGEVASTISRYVRTGEMEESAARDRLDAHDEWVRAAAALITTDPVDIQDGARLVRRFELQIKLPDAIHLAACRRRGDRLATFDRRLARRATGLGVAVESG